MDKKHINLVFIGHVDAGKSSLSGAILIECGMIDQRTIDKLKENAKKIGMASWWKSHITDTDEQEQLKGKTVETARAHFETNHKKITILDAPGHKAYVPNMIEGASQADVALLVVSARRGEFEAGFDRGGQTREHVVLCRTLGVAQIIVVVNKMDDVGWKKERYFEIQKKLSTFLSKSGYGKGAVEWVPISAMTSENLQQPKELSWYKGCTLLELIDNIILDRSETIEKEFRLPVLDSIKESGKLKIIGKIESGKLNVNDTLIVIPSEKEFKISSIDSEFESSCKTSTSGDNITITTKGLDDIDVFPGSVVVKKGEKSCFVANEFIAQIKISELPPNKPILSAGFTSIIHIHTAKVEISCIKVIKNIKTNKKTNFGRKGDFLTVKMKLAESTPLEKYNDFPQLGRFTLRNNGITTCVGKIMKIKQL